jgi:hypothetical protein
MVTRVRRVRCAPYAHAVPTWVLPGKWSERERESDVSRVRDQLLVMRTEMYKAVGDLWGIEGEVGFREKVKTGRDAETGNRLAVADVDRFYTCPECGERGQLPPEDELRRLAEEQGG